MLKISILLVALIGARVAIAEDVYDERAQTSYARAAAEKRAQDWQSRIQYADVYERTVLGFANAHGGLADGGDCSGWPYTLETVESFGGYDQVHFQLGAVDSGSTVYVVSFCKLNLNNGWACDIDDTFGDNGVDKFSATCYDGNSNRHDLTFGGRATPRPHGRKRPSG